MHEGSETGKALAILSEVATLTSAADWLEGTGHEPPGPAAGACGLLRFESAEGGMRRAWLLPHDAPDAEGDEHTAISLRGLACARVVGVEKRAASWTLLDGRPCEPDEVGNLQPLCGACNRAKGTGTQAELIAKLRERGQLAA